MIPKAKPLRSRREHPPLLLGRVCSGGELTEASFCCNKLGMAEEDVFTLRGIVRKLRAAFHLSEDDEPSLSRAVRYWAAEGLLRPKGAVHTGRGRNRSFEPDEVVRAGILFECSRWNVTVGTMKLLLSEVEKVKGRWTLLKFIDNLPRGIVTFAFVEESGCFTIIDSGRKPIDSHSLLCLDLKKIANDLGL